MEFETKKNKKTKLVKENKFNNKDSVVKCVFS